MNDVRHLKPTSTLVVRMYVRDVWGKKRTLILDVYVKHVGKWLDVRYSTGKHGRPGFWYDESARAELPSALEAYLLPCMEQIQAESFPGSIFDIVAPHRFVRKDTEQLEFALKAAPIVDVSRIDVERVRRRLG